MRYFMLPWVSLVLLFFSFPAIAADVETLVSQAREQLNSQAYDQAEKTLKRAILIKKRDIEARFLLARISELREDYTDAIKRYKYVLFLNRKYVPAIVALARSAEKLGDNRQALNAYIKAFKQQPDQLKWLFERVRLDMKNSSNRSGTEKRLKKLIKAEFRQQESLKYIIELYHAVGIKYKAKKYEKILASIEPAILPKNKKEVLEKASREHFNGIEIRPAYVSPSKLIGKGNADLNMAEPQRVSNEYKTTHTLSSKSEYNYLKSMIASAKISKLKLAASANRLREFVDENPSQAWVRTISNYYLGLNRLAEEDVFVEAMKGKSEVDSQRRRCEAYYYLGQKRLWKGDQKAAIAYFLKAIDTKIFHVDEYSAAKAMLNALGEKLEMRDSSLVKKTAPSAVSSTDSYKQAVRNVFNANMAEAQEIVKGSLIKQFDSLVAANKSLKTQLGAAEAGNNEPFYERLANTYKMNWSRMEELSKSPEFKRLNRLSWFTTAISPLMNKGKWKEVHEYIMKGDSAQEFGYHPPIESYSMSMLNLLGEKAETLKSVAVSKKSNEMVRVPVEKGSAPLMRSVAKGGYLEKRALDSSHDFIAYTPNKQRIKVKSLAEPERKSANWEYIIKPQFAKARDIIPSDSEVSFILVSKNKLWGVSDLKGKLIIPHKFKQRPEIFKDGIGVVSVKKGFITIEAYFIGRNGKPLSNKKFQKLTYYPEYGYARAIGFDGNSLLVSPKGRTINPQSSIPSSPLTNGRAMFSSNNQCGYLDEKGAVIIKAKYHKCGFFNDRNTAIVSDRDNKCGYIDRGGKEVIPLQYQYCETFAEGAANVSVQAKGEDREYFFIDANGDELFNGFKHLSRRARFNHGVTFVSKRVTVGCYDKETKTDKSDEVKLSALMNRDGQFITPYNYWGKDSFSGHYASVKHRDLKNFRKSGSKGHKCFGEVKGNLDIKGNFYKPYKAIPLLVKKDAPFWKKLVHIRGLPVNGEKKAGLSYFYDGMEKEEIIITPQFDSIHAIWRTPFFKVEVNKKWGVIRVK